MNIEEKLREQIKENNILIYMKGGNPKSGICNDFEVYCDLRTKSRIKVVLQYGYVLN